MRNARTIAAGLLLLAATTAAAATDEETCLAKRIAATGKYDQCVSKIIGKVAAGAALDDKAQAKLAKCRIKYDDVWTKLSALADSPTCSGKPRFEVDTYGALVDNLSGLAWEMKDDGNIHSDKDNFYTWTSGSPFTAIGTAFTDFLPNVNGIYTGARRDWRIPSIAELMTILAPEPYPCTTSPCVASAFQSLCSLSCNAPSCSCTLPAHYWTDQDQFTGSTSLAWAIDFDSGELTTGFKSIPRYTRAVSGGRY